MAMKTFRFYEIIEGSTQKSLLSGQPGFGIRTITRGLDENFARKVSDTVGATYETMLSQKVSMQQITADPAIVTRYPRTLKYTAVRDDNGKEWYAVACSTYVGIDYGYFCGIESARRTGSNYVADILVFDQRPTAGLFYELVRQRVFLPKDNTCSPDNPELKALLTGEPQPLEPREITITEPAYAAPAIDGLAAKVAMALLQTKINHDLGKPEGLQNIVFMADESTVPSILKAIAALPDNLVGDKYFQTNYLQGYGMPTGYRMIFINEYNETEVYTDNYVTLDLRGDGSKNIDFGNPYFLKITEAAESGDYKLFSALVGYLADVSVQADTDYTFLYNLFVATETDFELKLDSLTPGFFTKVKKASLPADKAKVLKASVNRTLCKELEDGRGHEAMKVVAYLLDNMRDILALTEKARQQTTNVMFIDGKLASYVKEFGIDKVQYVNTKDISHDDFFKALKALGDAAVWTRLVKDQFNDCKSKCADIINSALECAVADKVTLVKSIFPLPDYKSLLLSYFIEKPQNISRLEPIVRYICTDGGRQVITLLIKAGGCSQNVVSVIGPIANDYYESMAANGIEKCVAELTGLMDELPECFGKMDFSPVFAQYEKHCYDKPQKADAERIRKILSGARLKNSSREVFETLLCLNKGAVTEDTAKGTFKELMIAKRLGKSIDERLIIFAKWLRRDTDTKQIAEYMADGSPTGREETERMIKTVWNSATLGDERGKFVLAIIDAAKWRKAERTEFVKNCGDERLAAFINSEFSFFKCLLRKLFKKK